MADFTPFTPGEIGTTVAGAAGSVASLKFIPGRWYEKLGMVVGGAVAARYLTYPLIDVFGLLHRETDEAALAFLIGLFGMAVANKLFEALAALNSAEIVTIVTGWFKKRTGA